MDDRLQIVLCRWQPLSFIAMLDKTKTASMLFLNCSMKVRCFSLPSFLSLEEIVIEIVIPLTLKHQASLSISITSN